MASYFPPTEDLPIFDSAVFSEPNTTGISAAEAAAKYLARTGVATSIASSTTFSAEVGATSFTSLNSGATNFHFDNLPGNLAPLIIRNQSTGFDTIYRQLGTTNSHIFQTNGAGTTNLTLSNTANTFGTLGLTSQGNLSFTNAAPIISSTSITNNLRLQGGVGQGVAFLVDGGALNALSLETTGVLTCNSTLRAIATGTAGLTIQNRSGNTGGLVALNSDTSSDLIFRQAGTTRSLIFQTNTAGTTNMTLSNTLNTSSLPLLASFAAAGNASRIIEAVDTTSGNRLALIPSTTNGNLGPMCLAGDTQIVSTTGGAGNSILSIMPWTNTTVGIRMTGTQLTIGAGGTASVAPTSAIIFNANPGNATMNGTYTVASQMLWTPGATITATGSLATTMSNMYFITAAGAITITLPTAGARYTGTYATFRRTAAGGIITINETGGASTFLAAGSTTAAASVSIAAATVSFEFVCNGTLWCQLY